MNPHGARATSIRIFLAQGTPDGLRIVEKSNWTGRAVVASRAQLDHALKRDELSQPGVYALTGVGDEGVARIYIGEADVLRDRLKQHVSSKEFWTRLVAFSSTNEGLNKAHVRYLESRLIALAKQANQWEVDNGNAPGAPPLSEADRADAEWFLAEMLVIFPILGIDAFTPASTQARESAPDYEVHASELVLRERGADARGREVADGFIVLEGSNARADETSSIHGYISDLRKQLIERGVMAAKENGYLFTQDYRFTSASLAAGVLVGGTANGRLAWRDSIGRTLKALQEARAEAAG